MAGLLEALNRNPAGKYVATGFAILAVIVAGYFIFTNLGAGEVVADTRDRTFICSETGKTFQHEIEVGETFPVKSPHSGKNTGFPAEPCYWTKDAKPKDDPSWVLLNSNKGQPEPTFCPDCGRLVVPLNPFPTPTSRPPPTEPEYKARRQQPRGT
jgi:hypothetical protein